MAKTEVNYFEVAKIDSIADMINQALEKVPEKDVYRYAGNNGETVNVTYGDFIRRVYALGAFLESLGYDTGHIACIGPNSVDWITAYFAVLRSAGVFTPIDKELPEKDILNLISESDSSVLFCSEKYERKLANSLPDTVKYVICFEREEDEGNHLSFRKAIEKGASLDPSAYLNKEHDIHGLKMIVFTSGTTGVAKGVMLSEKNLISDVYGGLQLASIPDVGLSVLPYHHTYEAVSGLLLSFHNHSTLCINESPLTVVRNFAKYKPSYILVVPAYADMFYNRIMRSLKKEGKEKDFQRLISKSNAARKVKMDMRKELFAQVREIFGGNLEKIICGGAAVRPTVAKFFEDIGIDFICGYGITECSPLVSVNHDGMNDYTTAGIQLPCLDLRISQPDDEGVGEVCVRGDTVMLGYYKRPDLTEEVMKRGWFYTGDYGFINEDGYLVICGRKKNVIVLSNGKNIYPEEIEGYIQDIDYVNEVIVSGETDDEGNDSSLTAEVFLSEVKTAPEVLRNIRNACRELPVYKQISRVIIRDKEFDKTTTNKIKRFIGKKKTAADEDSAEAEDK